MGDVIVEKPLRCEGFGKFLDYIASTGICPCEGVVARLTGLHLDKGSRATIQAMTLSLVTRHMACLKPQYASCALHNVQRA